MEDFRERLSNRESTIGVLSILVGSMFYRIVVLPDRELWTRAVSASSQLMRYGVLFVLGETRCVPHITLYKTQLSPHALNATVRMLASRADSTGTLDLRACGYAYSDRYVVVNYERTQELMALQMAVVAAVNVLLDQAGSDCASTTVDSAVKRNVERYAYRNVGELFRPHVTLTRVAKEKVIDTSILPSSKDFSGHFTQIAVCESGDNGICARPVAEFPLASAGP